MRDLKAQSGGDIGVHGSIELAQSSSEDIGRLELLSATPTPSGSVLLAYRLLR